ncbi:MAG: insulinase family protein [Deltaproteobacteria bacterium]|nr:insulinase family protein [Deltaproteobacteria bacterium]
MNRSARADIVQTLSSKQVENWAPPNVEVIPLKNGIKLFLLEDKELPIVTGKLWLRAGDIYDPANLLGTASLTASLLRLGGAGADSPDVFNAKLEDLAASIGVEVFSEYSTVSFKTLSQDLAPTLELFFTMLQNPKMDESRLEILKAKAIDQIKRQNDLPGPIASREFKKMIYGQDNIWARTSTQEMIKAIKREDLMAFFKKYYVPNQINLAIAGNFKKSQVLALIHKHTSAWAKSEAPLPELAGVQRHYTPGKFFIDKQADQATLVVGHFGDKRDNPDKFALILLNYILGGETLTSRLGVDIRSTQGLAYAIYSSFGLDRDYGIFRVVAQTKVESAGLVIQSIMDHLQHIREPGNIQAPELAAAKAAFLNSLFSSYEPKFNIVAEEARFDFLGYPPHYLQIFAEKIKAVTLSDLQRVAKDYLRPEGLKILVVGDGAKLNSLIRKQEWQIIPLDKGS